jgi:hypothetical protein
MTCGLNHVLADEDVLYIMKKPGKKPNEPVKSEGKDKEKD